MNFTCFHKLPLPVTNMGPRMPSDALGWAKPPGVSNWDVICVGEDPPPPSFNTALTGTSIRRPGPAHFRDENMYSDPHPLCLSCWIIPRVTPVLSWCAGLQVKAYLDCRSCLWSRGGTCICWVPRTPHACSQADRELYRKDSERKREISAASWETTCTRSKRQST